MPRPKSPQGPKKHLNLTVSDNTLTQLQFMAHCMNMSVSEMIASYAEQNYKRIAKRQGVEPPAMQMPGQTSIK